MERGSRRKHFPPSKRSPKAEIPNGTNGMLFSSNSTMTDKMHSDALRVLRNGSKVEDVFIAKDAQKAPADTKSEQKECIVENLTGVNVTCDEDKPTTMDETVPASECTVAEVDVPDSLFDFDKELKSDLEAISKKKAILRWYTISVKGMTFVGWPKSNPCSPTDPENVRNDLIASINDAGLLPGVLSKCFPVHSTCHAQMTEICSTLTTVINERLPFIKMDVEGTEKPIFDYDVRLSVRNNTKLEKGKLLPQLTTHIETTIRNNTPDVNFIMTTLNKRGKKLGAPSRFMFGIDICQNSCFIGFIIDNRANGSSLSKK